MEVDLGLIDFKPPSEAIKSRDITPELRPRPALVNEQKRREWVRRQEGISPALATALAEGVTRVSFEEFQEYLAETVAEVNSRISPDEEYVIIADDPGKSFWWVLELSHPLLPPKMNVVHLSEVGKFSRDNPEIKKFLYLDDAAYSGTQAGINLSSVRSELAEYEVNDGIVVRKPLQDKEIVVAIPYATQYARDEWARRFRNDRVSLLGCRRIDSVAETLSAQKNGAELLEECKRVFEEYMREGEDTLSKVTSTYFDHKKPDYLSFFTPINTGQVIGRDGSPKKSLVTRKLVSKPFLPTIVPPYRNKPIEQVTPSLKDVRIVMPQV